MTEIMGFFTFFIKVTQNHFFQAGNFLGHKSMVSSYLRSVKEGFTILDRLRLQKHLKN